jgi:hypothetical protein
MSLGRGVVEILVVSALVLVPGAGCRKETVAVADGGRSSSVVAGGAAGGAPRRLGKDRSESADAERYVVRLERSECYGVCPAYGVQLSGDGLVEYEGKAFVAVRGRATSRVGGAAVAALIARFEAAGFFRLDWDDPCDRISTDSPTSTLTFVRGGRKRTIADYHGNGCMPPVLRELENEVDRVAATAPWVMCDAGDCRE